MISILIPIYNQEVKQLLGQLQMAIARQDQACEIITIDDHSSQEIHEINQAYCLKNNIAYTRLDENIGRSRIRNVLATKAKYDYLLFLDCDSLVPKDDFLQCYLHQLRDDLVVYGGTIYSDSRPIEKYILHWSYGKKYEAKVARIRAVDPWQSFHSNNFLVAAAVFEIIKFDITISNYGYEDVKFAKDSQSHGIEILHIDNPVLHVGLEENQKFIEKTKQSLNNLFIIENKDGLKTKLTNTNKAIPDFVKRGIKALHLSRLLEKIVLKFPNCTLLFQVWKLLYYSGLQNKKED